MKRIVYTAAVLGVLIQVAGLHPAASGVPQSRDEANVGMSMTLVPLQPRRLDRALLPIPIAAQPNPVRIHLRVLATGSKPWSVVVESLSGVTVTNVPSGQFAGDEYWTDEIADGGARVRVKDGDADTNVVVDAYAVRAQLAQPQGKFGDKDESLPITDPAVPAAAKKAGPSVARIQFMTETGGADCTGFLVGVSLLMTNHHCINSDARRASARVEFGIDSPGATSTTFTLVTTRSIRRKSRTC